jgi:hypothetical protein
MRRASDPAACSQVNEWVYDPKETVRRNQMKVDHGFSPFLEKFLDSNYSKPGVC